MRKTISASPVGILQAIMETGWRETTHPYTHSIPTYSQFKKDAPTEDTPYLWYALEVLDAEKLKVRITDDYFRRSIGQSKRTDLTAEVGSLENLKRLCQWLNL